MSASWLWQVRLQRFSLEDRDPLNCFNEHVKGPLRALVESQIGSELHVPFHIALTACLPMIFYSSVNVLACDNGPCETSAVLSGYSSVTQYMVTQVVGWTLTIFLSFPVTSPILLRMINFVVSCSDGPLELFMALLCCPLAYIWSYICGSLIWGSIVALVQILGDFNFPGPRLAYPPQNSSYLKIVRRCGSFWSRHNLAGSHTVRSFELDGFGLSLGP